MHIHILGVCGSFMGGIALLAKQSGYKVTGCDANVYPPMSNQLEKQDIAITNAFSADQVKLNPDVFVIGNVITRGNPLMEEILNRGLPYVSGPQWLAENILRDKWVMAVAGTHGKTTTASMLAWILEQAGFTPGFLIGGVPENFGISARLSETKFFVIEADEYDTAFFDKRSKFVHYRSRTTVLNNLEFDHADIFPDLAAIETQFHHLVRTLPSNGQIIANGRDANIRRVLQRGCWTPVEFFGTDQQWQAESVGSSVVITDKGKTIGALKWSLLGEHNRLNALAALLAARHAGVHVNEGIAALQKFLSVKRRMEVKGVINGITVYDDFAHHPTAIRTTLEGLRDKVDGARIIAVLEPRSNTMKMGVMKDVLAESLALADQVFCYTANLSWDAKAALQPLGGRAHTYSDLEQLLRVVVSSTIPGDHVLIMSNGDFGNIHSKLLEALSRLREVPVRPRV
ncbi:MAG TPA: UDP-N-acetylmuramate:L-alanyl-gamma-D-glutamyl-meso-diaminopimelate ligase [Burkholderiales bacterium]|nr:UDP-N-acetylmuramate:L-alanyl-gamma-D-glutamyl-meso-diaminopimelate ligase [Burkholderiales bacterium]